MGLDAFTPGRTTTITFDVPETVAVCDAWGMQRFGGEIQPYVKPGVVSSNIKFWPSSGAYTLMPVQEDISQIHELIDTLQLIIPPGLFVLSRVLAAGGIAEISTEICRANSDLPGMAFGASVAARSDKFYYKQVPAGSSWVTTHPSTYPQVPGISYNFAMDRAAESTITYDQDQGFCIRWRAPGTGQHYPGYLWTFSFGQYAIVIKGNGQFILWEYCTDISSAYQWRNRATYRYCRPSNVSNASHSLLIFPHLGPNSEKFISFTGNQPDIASHVSGFAQGNVEQVAPTEYLYEANTQTRGTDTDMAGVGHVTTSQPIRWDRRRDYRGLGIQVSTLGFATSGTLYDKPSLLQGFVDARATMSAESQFTAPTGTTVFSYILDDSTNTAYNAHIHIKPYVQINFTGTGHNTPILWGYRLYQPALTETITPGSFSAVGNIAPTVGVNSVNQGQLRKVSLTGFDGDASHETGMVSIEDPANALPRLKIRGEFTAKITTTFLTRAVPAVAKTCVLFRGKAIRPRRKQHEGAIGRIYPADKWFSYEVPLVGIWSRLEERVQGPILRLFADDTRPAPQGHNASKNANGSLPPWKVTDAIAEVLKMAGFPTSMINITDLPLRLWPGRMKKAADTTVTPNASFSAILQTWANNYLRQSLYFEPNAGSDGQWILIPKTLLTASPIWNFVTVADVAGIPPHLPQAYASTNSMIVGRPEYYVVPPEYNLINVIAPMVSSGSQSPTHNIQNFFTNPLSFNTPGFTVTADPNNADYLGRCRAAVIMDPSLTGKTEQETQAAVDFWTITLADRAAHAQSLVNFRSSLEFIKDLTLGVDIWRPLRFQDPVTVDGDAYLIKSVNINYDLGSLQYADYECIKPIAAS